MRKHLLFKASALLVVMFFHSFVLVPMLNASVYEAEVAKAFYQAVAPSVVAATPAGRGYLLAMAVGSAVIYIAVKSGAVTSIKNWLNGYYPSSIDAATHTGVANAYVGSPIGPYYPKIYFLSSNGYWTRYTFRTSDGVQTGGGGYYTTFNDAYRSFYGVDWVAALLPTVPTNYSAQAALTQPSLNTNDVFGSQGLLPWLLGGGATLVKATQMPDADLDKMKEVLGLTSPDSATGVQPKVNLNDNTLTPEANQSIPLLQQIVSFVSNLLGIKTDTGSIKTNTDNLVAGQSAQTTAAQQSLGKLDNIAVLSQAQKNTMDNVGVAINNQTTMVQQSLGKLDNVATATQALKDAVTTTTATQSGLSTRISAVKTLLLTKFPFSIVAAVTAPGAVSGGTYTIPDLHFPLGTVVSVDPLANTEIHGWVTWVRGLMAMGMWAIFILVMVRRVTEI